MPHPVVAFEIVGQDSARLVEFYRAAFGWEIFVTDGGYAFVETDAHEHDEETGATTYTGDDAFMNAGVEVGADDAGSPTWRYRSEPADTVRYFARGLGGGISEGAPRITIYVQVRDLGGSLARIEAAGGRRVTEPVEVAPDIWVAEFADPEGNVVGLLRG